MSSVIVVKRAGLANMAICNSIGSNIFDILFCLGVPWLLKSIIIMVKSGSIDLAASAIPIQSLALPLTSLTLLITIFALIATFQLTNWKLGLTVGITCSLIYLSFVTIASVLEFNLA
jgi:Ca2+/Na+ antiporter